LSALSGDAGARSILERHAAEIIAVPIEDSRTWQDIDTTEDLAAARQAAGKR
jgi:CTP:molybdopterin cytidylyltransferase MocA